MSVTAWLPNLEEIKCRVMDATPGPWRPIAGGVVAAVSSHNPHSDLDSVRHYGGALIGESMVSPNAAFVAAARSDVPQLLNAIGWLDDVVTDLEGQLVEALVLLTDDQIRQLPTAPAFSVLAERERLINVRAES